MAYIITATFQADDVNLSPAIEKILFHPDIRFLSRHGEEITVDVPGDFNAQAEITLKLCKLLVESGIYRFRIDHSF